MRFTVRDSRLAIEPGRPWQGRRALLAMPLQAACCNAVSM